MRIREAQKNTDRIRIHNTAVLLYTKSFCPHPVSIWLNTVLVFPSFNVITYLWMKIRAKTLCFLVKIYYLYIVQSVCTVHNKCGFFSNFALIIFLSTTCLLSCPLAPCLSNWFRKSVCYARTTSSVHRRLSKKPGSLE
jgi:hypothetical protein